jgi:putative transposase
VPRDREGTFEPQIVKKRQRRLTEVDEIVLSLYAKGMTTGEISAHFAEIYGASVSKETISRITDKVVAEMTEWSTPPLDSVYVAVFREGQVVNRPIYAAIGVTVDGRKDVPGAVGRLRRRGRQVLDECPRRSEEPWRAGCVLRRL